MRTVMEKEENLFQQCHQNLNGNNNNLNFKLINVLPVNVLPDTHASAFRRIR